MTKHTGCFSCGFFFCDGPAAHFVCERFRPPRQLHTCNLITNHDVHCLVVCLSLKQSGYFKRVAKRFPPKAPSRLGCRVTSQHAGGQTGRQFPIFAVPLNQCGRLSESQTGIPPETHGMTKTWENKGTKSPKCLVQ